MEMDPPRKPGRPPGRTERGEEMRQRLYAIALSEFSAKGYEQTTLTDIARAADVSPALLYKYFPNKAAVVLALYDELSTTYAETVHLPSGNWVDRFHLALESSLMVLSPHRKSLSALLGVLLGDPSDGLFAERTAFSRERVQPVFRAAVVDASDAPKGEVGEALGRCAYLLQLAVILWWLLDRSPDQRATTGLIHLLKQALPLVSWALMLPGTGALIQAADTLATEAFFSVELPSP